MDWTKYRADQWKCVVVEGEYWIGDDTGSRSGKFEVEFTAEGRRTHLGRTKSEDAAKKLCEKHLKALRSKKDG